MYYRSYRMQDIYLTIGKVKNYILGTRVCGRQLHLPKKSVKNNITIMDADCSN